MNIFQSIFAWFRNNDAVGIEGGLSVQFPAMEEGVFARWLVAVLVLLLVAGCKSPLKTNAVDPGLAGTSIQLEDARGPLSSRKSADILGKLRRKDGHASALEQHIAVEESVAQSSLVTGNKVSLLEDGPATYKAMIAAIRAARDHINMETYIIENDEVGRRFADLLLKKRTAGVEVNLIYDGVGSINTPKEFFDRLRDGGVRVLEFNPVNPLTAKKGWQLNNRDHRKLLVVDGRTAFIGGINISSVYSSGSSVRVRPNADGTLPWRDTQIRIDGPVVADFQKSFIETWKKQKGEPMTGRSYFPRLTEKGDEIVRALSSDADEEGSAIYTTLLSAINSAESSVHITNAYFAPNVELVDALKNAAARGVDVKLILPSRTDSWLIFHAGRSHYTDLLEAGVGIYERRDALLHAKTVLVDEAWSTIGSTNLDWRSFVHNNELNAVILGNAFSQRMKEAFARDLQASEKIDPEQWASRPLNFRMREWMARLWEYWL